jgi:hypothetical protein
VGATLLYGVKIDLLWSDRRPLRSPEESKKEEVEIKKFGVTRLRTRLWRDDRVTSKTGKTPNGASRIDI